MTFINYLQHIDYEIFYSYRISLKLHSNITEISYVLLSNYRNSTERAQFEHLNYIPPIINVRLRKIYEGSQSYCAKSTK